jgi:hypothetical protein
VTTTAFSGRKPRHQIKPAQLDFASFIALPRVQAPAGYRVDGARRKPAGSKDQTKPTPPAVRRL